MGAVEIVSGSAASGDVSLFTYEYADRLSFRGGSWSGSYDTGYLEKKMYGRDHGPHNMYTNAYLNEMFTNLSGRVNFTAGMHEDYGNPTCSNPYFRIAGSAGKRYETGSDAHPEGGNSLWGGGTLYWTPWKYASYAFATDADGGDAKYLQFGQYGVNGQNLAGDYGRASTDGLTLTRRLLTAASRCASTPPTIPIPRTGPRCSARPPGPMRASSPPSPSQTAAPATAGPMWGPPSR